MSSTPLPIVPYHRKKSGRTNYKKRLRLLVSQQPRLVIRKSSKNILGQIVEYHPDGDRVLLTTTSQELKKLGWNYSRKNLPASYLTGLLLGKKAQEKKIKGAILDIGLQTSVSSGRIYALLQGALETGLQVPHDQKVLPKPERLTGQHIHQYLPQAPASQFTQYKKQTQPLPEALNNLKQKIIGKG